LSENRTDTYRSNSDALALGRAGVKHERPEEMVRLRPQFRQIVVPIARRGGARAWRQATSAAAKIREPSFSASVSES
jgi:hypothetical protein